MGAGKQTDLQGQHMLFRAKTSPAQGGWFFETKLYYAQAGLELIKIFLPLSWAPVTMLCWLRFLTRQRNDSTIQSVACTLQLNCPNASP
ncbi:hypothetical protein I79_002570 [Cricetulus griseus]|uniref:Uncharacterized protein n=1 Tax=Cricetulus griseus TaxID=10029 RepID=G3GXS7_CRIGR|nr:hypothetical protein I79_002570 [Cricetulus griseus]